MLFRSIGSVLIGALVLLSSACSDPAKEKELVDLFTAASQDLIEISFPTNVTEDVISINTYFDYQIQGLRSNGVDTFIVTEDIEWSISAGASSAISQAGRLTTGAIAEVITITAKVGGLTTSLMVRVSDAKFHEVVQLNPAPVAINMCQSQNIKPIGRYVNDDLSEEIRPVDNTLINTITWKILNQAGVAPSLKAHISTFNSQATLQAFEAGDIIIQAEAFSAFAGSTVTSADFNQTLDNNLQSMKLCQGSATDLAGCSISQNNLDVVVDTAQSVQAVGNYQAADGSTYNQNISANSKWGIDDDIPPVASLAFSGDRSVMNVTGLIAGLKTQVTAACGEIAQTVTDVSNGVVLGTPVTCAAGDCEVTSVFIDVAELAVSSLSVTANGQSINENERFLIEPRPATVVLEVTANFTDGSSRVVTTDSDTTYGSPTGSLSEVAGSPGEYTVSSDADGDVDIFFEGQLFFQVRLTFNTP